MAYKYGKTFKKDGKMVRYRYTDGKKSTKKLVAVKCGSTAVDGVIVDDENPKQPIIHFVCESCGTEWVE